MNNYKYDIFISYRRLDSNGKISGRDKAHLLQLKLQLKGYDVFFDYSEIKDNQFEQTILPAIRNCDVFILLLTNGALDRCKNEGDWVAKEVLEALRCNKKIITVNPNYEFKEFPIDLPKELSILKDIQMSDIDLGSNFDITVEKMITERISEIVQPTNILENSLTDVPDGYVVKLGKKTFRIPEEFYSKDVYEALKRAYL